MSSLLETDSSVALSVTLKLTTTSQTLKKGKKSSPVWAYTRMPLKDENLDLFYCFYYKQGLTVKRAPYGSKKLSAIIKHINKYHLLIIIEKVTNKKQEIIN
jgi:hypothetical protein